MAAQRGAARKLFLIHGEDGYRARLRAAELVGALTKGEHRPSDLRTQRSPDLGAPLGLSRYDARETEPSDIELAGRSQGLFDTVDEPRLVFVEHAEALRDPGFVSRFPAEATLVLLSEAKVATRARRTAKPKAAAPAPVDLAGAVEASGGSIEHITKLAPQELPGWIAARATLVGVELAADAISELAAAAGSDTERIDNELAKLAAFAGRDKVTGADVQALVPGAIETDVFKLTEAIVRGRTGEAIGRLNKLLEGGQAEQQVLALLLWQFRILLFASAMKTHADAERMAKAIRSSSSYSIEKWQPHARTVTRARIVRAYEAIYATDLAIKTGRTDPETAMTLCVLDLCGVQSADPRQLVVGEPPRR